MNDAAVRLASPLHSTPHGSCSRTDMHGVAQHVYVHGQGRARLLGTPSYLKKLCTEQRDHLSILWTRAA